LMATERSQSKKTFDLVELARDPRFIPGMYNYCDRWCERCPFTARCLVYAQEQQHWGDTARDVTNAEFWNKLGEAFQQTMEMVRELAAEQGIDLNKLVGDELVVEAAERRRRRREPARERPLARSAMEYARKMDAWFEAEVPAFQEKEAELNQQARLGGAIGQLDQEAGDIVDATEVLHWYQHQIYVKLARAMDREDDDFVKKLETDGFPNDADGSAKVALIGIDRSLAAWALLQEQFPEKADGILDFLVHLERLRCQTEAQFPKARAFQRPGFDTGKSPA
jgi:hypothetical protein